MATDANLWTSHLGNDLLTNVFPEIQNSLSCLSSSDSTPNEYCRYQKLMNARDSCLTTYFQGFDPLPKSRKQKIIIHNGPDTPQSGSAGSISTLDSQKHKNDKNDVTHSDNHPMPTKTQEKYFDRTKRNRAAAARYRQRERDRNQELISSYEACTIKNKMLRARMNAMRSERSRLLAELFKHGACADPRVAYYNLKTNRW